MPATETTTDTPPRFGTGIAVRDLTAYPAWLEVAEEAGFDLLTTGDSQSLWAEPFVSMTPRSAPVCV